MLRTKMVSLRSIIKLPWHSGPTKSIICEIFCNFVSHSLSWNISGIFDFLLILCLDTFWRRMFRRIAICKMSNYLPLGTLSFLYVGKSSWTPAVTGKSDFNVGLYRLNPTVVRLMLNRDALGPLPNYFRKSCVFFHFGGIVPRLVWALGGTTLLDAISWAVVQVWEDPRSSSACRPLWPPRVVQGRLSARNPARVGCSHRLPLCPLLYEHYSFAVGADSEELLLPPHCIALTTDEGSKLSLIASHRIRREGAPTPNKTPACAGSCPRSLRNGDRCSSPLFPFSAGISPACSLILACCILLLKGILVSHPLQIYPERGFELATYHLPFGAFYL